MMEFVNGKVDIPDMKWKIKFMFETTNQVQIGFDLTPYGPYAWDYWIFLPPAMAQMTNPTSSGRGATGALPEEFVPDSRLFRR